MRSQCPVNTQMVTMDNERPNETISAAVNRPHAPNDILNKNRKSASSLQANFRKMTTHLFPEVQGLRTYWHIGNSKKASATVAITAKKS